MSTSTVLYEHLDPQGQLGPEQSCRDGHAGQHTTFVLLHAAILTWFLYSTPHTPKLLRGLVGGAGAFTIGFHTLLGSVCWSSAAAAAMRVHMASSPLHRIRPLQWTVESLLASAIAAFIVLKSERPGRAAKLSLLSVFALAHLLSLVWWWTHDSTENTLRAGER